MLSGRRPTSLVLICMLLLAIAIYHWAFRSGSERLREAAGHELDLLATAINGEITRDASIPGAIAANANILALLRGSGEELDLHQLAANRFLQQLNDHLGGPSVCVLSPQGRVMASSDWIFSDNLLDRDLSYMPFFADAARGLPARHYGIDPVRKQAGVYFALPIRDEQRDWQIVGIAVLHSSVHALEKLWHSQETPAIIVDSNGIILFASAKEWRHASLSVLDPATRQQISERQFAGQPVGKTQLHLSIQQAEREQIVDLVEYGESDQGLALGSRPYLAQTRQLPGADWRLMVFADLRDVRLQALTQAALGLAALGCLLLGGLYLRQNRKLARSRAETQAVLQKANQALEQKVAARTADLSAAIGELQHEISERRRAEQTLRAAQDELVQAAKLAVLGQLAAGITHELSQPLGAIRTLAENAAEFMRRGNQAVSEKNLALIGQLTVQMAAIIDPLKSFARKSPAVPCPVDLRQAVESALFLFDSRLRKEQIQVSCDFSQASAMTAWCDPNRLQQVLVNLIANAIDAIKQAPKRQLDFALQAAPEGDLLLTLGDSGCGIPPELRGQLFEPFFTTKPAGQGLGLGLTISRDILRDFGGDLAAEHPDSGGTRFVIRLPTSPLSSEKSHVRSVDRITD